MDCIIIDDEATSRAIISKLCSRVEDLNVLEVFPNAIQAIKYLNQHVVDLIFLDIHMPDFTGFEFIDTLKNPPNIVLTTSDTQFAIHAFNYACIVDYILKPITIERFDQAMQRVRTQATMQASSATAAQTASSPVNNLFVNIDRKLIKIDMAGILLIEAKGDYIQIKTEDKNYTVHSTLKKIEDKLPTDTFLKVHRSYIINVEKIVDIEANSVVIDKDVIPVSRANKPVLMKRLNLL